MQEQLRIAAVETSSRQEVRADHLQAIPAPFVATEHQRGRLNCLLDHWDLALVEFEVDDLPRFGVLPGQLLFDLSLKFFFGQNLGFVQPGCTIELLTITSSR